jgi:ribosomal protein S19E (S16A)
VSVGCAKLSVMYGGEQLRVYVPKPATLTPNQRKGFRGLLSKIRCAGFAESLPMKRRFLGPSFRQPFGTP